MLTEREMTCAVLSVKEGTGFHAMAGGLRFLSNFPTRLVVRLKNKKIKRNHIPTSHARVSLSASGDAHATHCTRVQVLERVVWVQNLRIKL
jgi:hypothetical protein